MMVPCGRWDTDRLASKLPESLVLRHNLVTEFDVHWIDYKRNVRHTLTVTDELFQNCLSPEDGDQGRPREGPMLQLRAWIDWNTWRKNLVNDFWLAKPGTITKNNYLYIMNFLQDLGPCQISLGSLITGLLNLLCCIDIESPWSRTIFSSWAPNVHRFKSNLAKIPAISISGIGWCQMFKRIPAM